MSRLHIIGIGGTGHKVLASVIHLAACGAFKEKLGDKQISAIRVMTIDADDANGNLTNTITVLNAYQKFSKAIGGQELIDIETVDELNLSLYDGKKNSISSTFNIAKYKDSDEEKLIRFLYTDTEIDAEFNHGFYGHTSIGTLIVSNFLDKFPMWKKFLEDIRNEDFVMVIGSIFGGTGASAMPVVIDILNEKKKGTPFNLAALILTPYFKTTGGGVKEEKLLMPDSANFNIKAKSALYYYYAQNKYRNTDVLYIIGEPESNFSNELYSRGAVKQRNKAHPIELFAATAIFDFISESKKRSDDAKRNESSDLDNRTIITANRGCDKSKIMNYYTWNMLKKANEGLPAKIESFLKIAIIYTKRLYSDINGIGAGIWPKFYPMLKEKRDDNQALYTYFKLFTDWIFELHMWNEIDKSTGQLIRKPDEKDRVRLFRMNNLDIFNSLPITTDIPGFDDLVYKKSSRNYFGDFYFKLNHPKDPRKDIKSNKGFFDLFSTALEIVRKMDESLEEDRKSVQAPEENHETYYFSVENGVEVSHGRPEKDEHKMWIPGPKQVLTDIADGLPDAKSESFSRDDVSIPSPWSIFIMNELALKENSKFAALNLDAYKQWCGLIALLALRKINHYENNGLEIKSLPTEMEKSGFIGTVKKTNLPSCSIFKNPGWTTDCHVVLLEGHTIAFLAHNTIVCPAYQFDQKVKDILHRIAPSIFNEGEFCPPDSYFKDDLANRKAKSALNLFLKELEKLITKELDTDEEDKKILLTDLQKKTAHFISDLGTTDGRAYGITIPEDFNDVTSVFGIFEKLSPGSDEKDELPFVLENTIKCQEGEKEEEKKVALIGLTVCGISYTDNKASNIHITDSLLFNQITQAKIDELKGKVTDGILLVHEKELLKDSLLLISKNNEKNEDAIRALKNSYHPEYQIVWPINDILLELYKVDVLNNMLAFTVSQNTITVTLTLKTKGKRDHVVKREYRIMDPKSTDQEKTKDTAMIYDRNRLPFWAVWPYSRLNDNGQNKWKLYYYFCMDPVYNNNTVFEIEPFFDIGGKMDLPKKLSFIKRSSDIAYYRKSNYLPVAFKIKEQTGSGSKYRGTVFLVPPDPKDLGKEEWNIGLDFGTTSTTAFYTTESNREPKFIQLLTEYKWKNDDLDIHETDSDIHILCDSGPERENDLDNYFIDKQCLDQQSYTTTYEVMDNNKDPGDQIFNTGRIFWHNHENFKKVNTDETGRYDRLRTNIKWERDRSFAKKYLNQLITQIVYYAAKNGAGKINWFFSYPTAFSTDYRRNFRETLDKILDTDIDGNTGLEFVFKEELNANSYNYNLLSESLAAAYYFRKENPTSQVLICVDIGGGTSDISVWKEGIDKNVSQTSIRFASRDMFVEPLKELLKRKSVMDIVRSDRPEDGINSMLSRAGTHTQDEEFKFLIESVLFEYYDKFRYRLNSLVDDDEIAYRNFQHYVLMAYSGLVFYLANIIIELMQTNDRDKKLSDFKIITFGLSGKGSKLTDWIVDYCDFIYEETNNFITKKTGTHVKLRPQLAKPGAAKTETAIGMICNLEGGKQKVHVKEESDLYTGCDIKITHDDMDYTYSKHNPIDVYKDKHFSVIRELSVELLDKDLPELEEFMEFFNRIVAKTRNEMQPIRKDWFVINKIGIWAATNEAIRNILKDNRFESPFVVMLNQFLDYYTKNRDEQE